MEESNLMSRPPDESDPATAHELVSLVYTELRQRAAAYLRRERPDHTLQPTALVHEAYLRLTAQKRITQNRNQFVALAATMMRRVLIDHLRAHHAAKRPVARLKVELSEDAAQHSGPNCDLLELDQALKELKILDPQQAQIVELRYFGGLAEHEVAQVLSISRSTATREWQAAKAWLYRRVTSGRATGDDRP
jgi:RNA polymerase sigma-70 factor, ECF subfamily